MFAPTPQWNCSLHKQCTVEKNIGSDNIVKSNFVPCIACGGWADRNDGRDGRTDYLPCLLCGQARAPHSDPFERIYSQRDVRKYERFWRVTLGILIHYERNISQTFVSGSFHTRDSHAFFNSPHQQNKVKYLDDYNSL